MEPGPVEPGPVHRTHVRNRVRGDDPDPSARQLPAAAGVLQRSAVHRRSASQRVQAPADAVGPAETAEHAEEQTGRKKEDRRIRRLNPPVNRHRDPLLSTDRNIFIR